MLFDKQILSVVLFSFIATGSAMAGADNSKIKSAQSTPEIEKVLEIKKPLFQEVVVTKKAVRVSFNKKPVQTTTTTTVPIIIPDNLKCPEYYLLAKEVGWPEDQLERLDYVMWRESRCDSSVHNKKDPASGSRGLIQINGFWCRPNRWTNQGFLQDQNILNACEDLFDPRINLSAGLAIYNYGVEEHGCGWGPWSTKKNKWCRK